MKRFLYAILSAAMLCLLFGSITVSADSADEENLYDLYYINSEETKVVSVKYHPESQEMDAMIQDFVTMLNDRGAEGSYQPLLPEGVRIDTWRISESLIELEFNREYGNLSRARELLVRVGTVRIFCQIPGISFVKIFVGSNELMDSKGQPVGEMQPTDFVEMWGSGDAAYRYDTFTLYFADKTGKELVPEQRSVYYRRSLSRERVILEQLAKGPMEKDHYPTIPAGTEIISVTTADRNCYVDFSSVFSGAQLDIPDNTMVYSIANTLLSVASADKVQISVEGNNEAVLRDGTSLYNAFGWNTALIAGES